MRVASALLVALAASPRAFAAVSSTESAANPIRRVVNLLQKMQTKVMEEGKKEEELWKKFHCYCNTGTGQLTESISAAEGQISHDTSALEQAEASKSQLEKELEEHKSDRADAQDAVAKAKAMREKEHTAFVKESGDYKTNVAALEKAINALDKGMSGTFLQTAAASTLRRLTIDMDLSTADRDMLSAFLSVHQDLGYSPRSGEISGILKEMKDTMEKDLASVIDTETSSQKDFEALIAAKEKEIATNSEAIETKTERVGQVGVEIVQLKEDLDDTSKALLEDKQFLADLGTNCATKKAEWEERSKLRADELLALADTIKLLNDDDALDLFKKTLPSPALLQTEVSGKVVKQRASKALGVARSNDPRLAPILIALQGRSGDFSKVIKMVDDMVALLAKEQSVDDEKKAYCEQEIDKSEDAKKELDQQHSDLEKRIEDAESTIGQLVEEIKALGAGIQALDKSVAEATETRKAENSEYKDGMAADTAAKELLGVAKNRLSKFYNPKMYKAPPKRELDAQGRVYENMGGEIPTVAPGGIAGSGVEAPALVQVREHFAHQGREAPPPPPETWDAYQNKGQENNGVMAMLDMLIADLDKDMQERDVEEKDSQKEYEQFMQDSAAKRAADSKSLATKEGAKAELEMEMQRMTTESKATLHAGMAKAEYLMNLHNECDWLQTNYDARKEARSGEVESLKNAKAILSGASFSFLQRPSLRGASFSFLQRPSLRGSAQ